MYYLHLKFRNCGLIQCDSSKGKSTSPHLERNKYKIGEDVKNDKHFGHDLSNPIPYTLLSNVLHVLCGEIPVPTKRQSLFERIPKLDEIAKNSFIKYETPITFDKFGKIQGREIFNTQKWNWESTLPITDTFTLHDNSTKTVSGWYNWNYFRRSVKNEENRKIILDFIESIIHIEPSSLTFKETVKELSKYWETPEFQVSLQDFKNKNENICKKSWMMVLFNVTGNSSNTKPNSSTPLVVNRGVGKIKYINGEIICLIEDETICDAIINNGCGMATLLENGMVYVAGLEKYHPYGDFNEEWTQIF